MMLSTLAVQLCGAMTFSTIPTYAAEVTDWNRFWMVLYVSMGIAALVSGFYVAPLTARIGRSRLLTLVCFTGATAILIGSQARSPVFAVIATALFGMSIPVSFIGFGAVVQRDAPEQARGRVLSIFSALVGTAFGTFSIVNGYLADKVFGLRNTLWVSALLLYGFTLVVMFVWRSWRGIVNGNDPAPFWRPDSLARLQSTDRP
jgi:MFS family permease